MQSKSFLLDQTAPTVTVNIPEGAVYTQGRPVPLTFSCADETGWLGHRSCVGSTPSGSNLPTGTAGMQVLTITATDNVGNVTVKTVNYRVLDATNTDGTRQRHRAGDARPDAGHAGRVRRVHAGRRQGLHRVDDGHRDLHRR